MKSSSKVKFGPVILFSKYDIFKKNKLKSKLNLTAEKLNY